ncbi:MBL fold metallo-hydrolase [Streptomyces viridochromogenes]|uniref:Putative Flavodoxin protein n=1 Tax=Streptomyces viridochromogenes Tue57 TaxID=1160705 RepID=L8PB61_STRVR|nr:MBL fold metallo-hydrolase [Streptomyces viridochromogenes]ELS54831.1 putative Flavodoxin protein [Streptomyces viridochromogenes Tue57]
MSTAEGIFEPKVEPYRIAPETYVIPQLLEAPPVGMFYVNSMVITGTEPVLVDTGAPSNRQQWLDHAWSLVDPADVRWVFLTHDDHDHAGNVRQVMAACPNATLVTTWFSMARYAIDTEEFWMPFNRSRWVRDGESFQAGDRTLLAIRPPFFDNPTTRGLFDATTRVYWAADTFATAIPHPAEDAADLDAKAWREGMLLGNRLNHPWHLWLDAGKFSKHVDRVQDLDIDTAASCHAPTIHRGLIDEAFDLVRKVPELPPWEEPGQDFLEGIIAATTKPVVS